jgi:CheY-like chemotaxis protein
MRDPPLILIVDDNADNREILEARLASQGYRCKPFVRCCRTLCSST